jgi:plastocyanin
MRRATFLVVLALLAGVLAACGGGGASSSGSETGAGDRTVLVDYRHDQFASAFLSYYPEHLKIRQGDTVHFRQAWTGEPHSVTFGKVVDDVIQLFPKVEQYEDADAAIAAGVPKETVDRVVDGLERTPSMSEGFDIAPAGAEPCFVDDVADLPKFRDIDTFKVDVSVPCPTKGRKQPAFSGKQALYNSGFIPYSGPSGNEFTVPIAKDAEPGTYRYFCNYHFIFMSGDIEVVPADQAIPSQQDVSKQALKEVASDAKEALDLVRVAKKANVGDTLTGPQDSEGPPGAEPEKVTLPLAGRLQTTEPLIINEFFPKTFQTKVGQKVTWTFDGGTHTVSFNVPKYFPIFTVAKSGAVRWDPKSHEPVGFDVPERPSDRTDEEIPPADVDAGTWDGRGGFHSSGALNAGDKFSVTFSKPGTYAYACVLHPQMVGTLEVKA